MECPRYSGRVRLFYICICRVTSGCSAAASTASPGCAPAAGNLLPAMPARFRFATSRCGWSPYVKKHRESSASKLAPDSPHFFTHGSSGFHMIIHTIPPLQSLTIFCMVSWSLTWHSSPIMEILLVMPSLTSCSTVFPKMLVSQMPSLSSPASEM